MPPLIPEFNPNIPGRFQPATPSLAAATAPGRALQQVGNDLSQAGGNIGDIGLRFQAANDQGVKSRAALAMQQAFADHQQFRLKNPDETKWPADISERVGKAKELIFQERMSPFMQTELESTFQSWSQDANNGAKIDATKQGVARARQSIMNEVRARQDAKDFAGAGTVLDNAVASGALLPEEGDADKIYNARLQKDAEIKQAFDAEKAKIAEDPKGWREKNATADAPEGRDPVEWQQLKGYARSLYGQEQDEVVSAVRDGIASGEITRLEQIADLAEPAGPRVVAALQSELIGQADQKTRQMRTMPAYQTRIMGKIADMLATLDPEDREARYEAEALIRQLEPGATKTQLNSQLTRKINGEPEDMSAINLHLKLATQAFKSGFFKRSAAPEPMKTETAIDRGFLKDSKKLAVWFSPEQIAKINEPIDEDKPATNASRTDAMRRLWVFRANQDAIAPDPFDQATAEAIANRKPAVEYQSPEDAAKHASAKWEQSAQLGRLTKHLSEWAAAQPEKAKDFEAVREEMLRFIGPDSADDFIDSALDGLEGFDDAMDGSVLPTRENSFDGSERFLPPP